MSEPDAPGMSAPPMSAARISETGDSGPGESGPASADLNAFLEPGMLVRHPDCPDWGRGQVQTNVGGRITVMFEEAGRVVLDGRKIALLPVFEV